MAWTERNTGLIWKWWLAGTLTDSDVDGVFQFVGAKDSTEAKRNWVDADAPATDVDSPTWTSREIGTTFDGVDDSYDSNVTLSSAMTVLILFNLSLDGQNDRMFGFAGSATTTARFRISKSNPVGVTAVIGSASPSISGNRVPGLDYVVGIMHDTPTKYIIFEGTKRDPETAGTFAGGGGDVYIGGVNGAGDPWEGPIKACVIYSTVLTDDELLTITNNMKMLGATTNLSQYVYWIDQHPGNRQRNNSSHELLAATEGGCFRTQNGGRSWEKLPLPDPSNAEFSDSPAATVDELSFRWIEYGPLDKLTLYAQATKVSSSRVWIYKSTDNGDTWSSRGVEVA